MNRDIASTFAEWRFLSLTLLICAYLLAAPLIVGMWQIQMLMEVLLLALLFAQVYLCLITWDPSSFSLPIDAVERPAQLLQSDMTYFSLVTLATVGYGDVLPATHTARMLAMFQAVTGQFYIAVVVALFVGKYLSQPRG